MNTLDEQLRVFETTAQKIGTPIPVENPPWPDPILLCEANLPELPINLFPSWYGDMVEAVSKATETPRELAAMLGLTTLSATCQRIFEVEPEPGYVEPVNVYGIAAMESGNRKTAVLNHMTAPLGDFEQEEAERLGPERKRILSERKTLEARVHFLRGQAAKKGSVDSVKEIAELENSIPKLPVIPQLWLQDVTPEKLGQVMAEQGGSISLISDEGGVFETFAGRYNKGIPNLDLLLKSHSRSPVRIHRASQDPIDMALPTLTMGLSPQPEILRGLLQKPGFRGCGLLARFLYVLPTSRLGFRSLESRPVSEAVKKAYGLSLRNLLKIEPARNADGTPGRFRLKLAPKAHSEWKEFSRMVEHDLREGERFEHLRDWAGKLPGAAVRVAALLHCAAYAHGKPWEQPVGLHPMESALEFMAILAEHAIQAFEVMAMNPDVEKGKKIFAWLQRKGGASFTLRDCHRDLQGSFKRADDLKPGLDVLAERSIIRLAGGQEPKKSGRPSVPYEVNPQLLERKKP